MKTELWWLAAVCTLTALIWIPYILDRITVWGLTDTVGYPETAKPQSAWAQRMMRAHDNAIENLAVFAALVLCANAAGITGGTIATASMIYFWARVVHLAAYTAAVPWVRTLAFFAGWIATMMVAIAILGR